MSLARFSKRNIYIMISHFSQKTNLRMRFNGNSIKEFVTILTGLRILVGNVRIALGVLF